jgi:hypothetical protein
MSQFHEVEEEHKHRLNQANEFFQSCLSEVRDLTEWEIVKNKILLYLHDYWSVIRLKTFKFLQSNASMFNTSQLQSLLEEFKACFVSTDRKEKPAWQEIHGSFLGYIAVLSMLESNHLNYLSDLCFSYIGHVSNPIRECCKDAVVQISKRKQNMVISKILEEIQKIITHNPSADDKNANSLKYLPDEQETLRLDGLLSCVVEIVPFMKISSFTLSSENSNTNKAVDSVFLFPVCEDESNTVLSLEIFILILKQCMLHNASTVRQKAGNITSKLFRMFLGKNECSDDFVYRCLAFVIDKLIIQVLSIHSLEYWNAHEAALIISEEIIRDFYVMYMDSFVGKNSNNISNDPSVLRELSNLLSFLEDELIIVLCHPRFEVRRVIIQSLPVIARGKIILEGAIYVLRKSDDKETSVGKRYYERHEEKKIKRESLNRNFLSAVEAVWISTLIKENRQLREINNVYVFSSPAIGENWGTEFHGRFLEVELRSDFRNRLASIAELSEGTAVISSALQVSDNILLELLELHFAKGSEGTEGSDSCNNKWVAKDKYISLDFVEFHILVECFLKNIINTSMDTYECVDRSSLSINRTPLAVVLQRLQRHSLSWVSMLVYFQYISNSETIPRNRYDAVCSTQATETALIILESGNVLETDDKSVSLEIPVLKYWKTGFEMTGTRLLPTLTDPATNPIIYAEEAVLSQSFDEGIANYEQLSISVLNVRNTQPPESSSIVSRPTSHPTTPTKTRSMNGSFSFSLGSPKASVPQLTPNNLGVGSNLPVASNINSYQGMNRWNCEAISPLLCQFSTFNANRTVSFLLSTVVVEWMMYSFRDASWLENRRFAKRMLFESFPNLITSAVEDNSTVLNNGDYSGLLVSLLKRVAEFWQCVNQTNEKNPSSKLSDLKLVFPVLKATRSMVKSTANLSIQQLQEANKRCQFTTSSIGSFLSALISSLKEETTLLKEIYKLSEAKETNSQSSETDQEKEEKQAQEEAEAEEEQEQEDEFSDWDDEDDSAILDENVINQSEEAICRAFAADLTHLEQAIENWSSRLL